MFPTKAAPRSRRVWFSFPQNVVPPSVSAGVSTDGLLSVAHPKTRVTQCTHHEKDVDPPLSPFTSTAGFTHRNGRYSHGHSLPSRGYNHQTLLRRAILSYTSEAPPKCDSCVSEFWEPADESFFRKRISPLIGFAPFFNHRFKCLVESGLWIHLIWWEASLPPAQNLRLHLHKPEHL